MPDLQIPYAEHAEIAVDARRDEPAWQSALRIPEPFVTFQPGIDGAPTGGTDVWVTTDADGFYLYFHARDPEPDKLRAALGRRDTRFGDDWVGFYLDPFGATQRGYLFVVTPAGVVGDGTVDATDGESVLVWRAADGDAACRALASGEAAFLGTLIDGRTLGEAAGAALSADASFDVATAIAALLAEPLFHAPQGDAP